MRYAPLAVALALWGAACTTLLQLPDVPIPADAGSETGSIDAAASETAAGDASDAETGNNDGAIGDGGVDGGAECSPGATQCDGLELQTCVATETWQSTGAVCPYACTAGGCVGTCVPGSMQCSGAQPQTCDGTGTWQSSGSACASPNVCTSGACASPCATGATQCSNNIVQTCTAGQWGSPMQCAFVCTAGSCGGVCTPGAMQCTEDGGTGGSAQSCGANGTWDTPVACTGGLPFCLGGACVACTPGAVQCSGNGIQACDPAGGWGSVTACTGQTCFGGACVGTCMSGATRCAGNSVETCDAMGNWGSPSACQNVCTAGSCAGSCTPGATTCSGNAVETCDSTGNWGSATACTPPQTCANGACSTNLDAGADACGPVEICDNGIDDNCDGKIDCADPECSGDGGQWACTALPATPGWTIAAYEPSARPACPTNFSGAQDQVISGVTAGPDSCGCNCFNTKAATCRGTWEWAEFSTDSCSGAITSGLPLTQGGCLSNPGDNLAQASWWKGAATGATTVAGTCSGVSAVANKPAVTASQGETCSLTQAGGGCAAGFVCAPIVTSDFQLCSTYPGAATCPMGTTRTSLYTGYTDTRSCGSCACGTEDLGCVLTGAEFFTSASCTGSACEISGSCAKCALPGTGDTSSIQGVFTNNGKTTSCSVTTGAQPTGTVTPNASSEITICCQP